MINNNIVKALILITLTINSIVIYAQSDFRRIYPKKILLGKSVVLNIGNVKFIEDCILRPDTCLLKYCLSCSNESGFKVIDTTRYSQYDSKIIAYKSKLTSDYFIFWVTEFEFVSDIHLLYLKGNKIIKAGTLPVLNTCQTCDDRIYPIEKIKIIEKGRNIEISFLEAVALESDNEIIKAYKLNELYFIYDKTTNKLKMVTQN